ncbi:Uncharacterised protein at_DN0280 [Pycnogonum litorale]
MISSKMRNSVLILSVFPFLTTAVPTTMNKKFGPEHPAGKKMAATRSNNRPHNYVTIDKNNDDEERKFYDEYGKFGPKYALFDHPSADVNPHWQQQATKIVNYKDYVSKPTLDENDEIPDERRTQDDGRWPQDQNRNMAEARFYSTNMFSREGYGGCKDGDNGLAVGLGLAAVAAGLVLASLLSPMMAQTQKLRKRDTRTDSRRQYANEDSLTGWYGMIINEIDDSIRKEF